MLASEHSSHTLKCCSRYHHSIPQFDTDSRTASKIKTEQATPKAPYIVGLACLALGKCHIFNGKRSTELLEEEVHSLRDISLEDDTSQMEVVPEKWRWQSGTRPCSGSAVLRLLLQRGQSTSQQAHMLHQRQCKRTGL